MSSCSENHIDTKEENEEQDRLWHAMHEKVNMKLKTIAKKKKEKVVILCVLIIVVIYVLIILN